MKKWYLGLAILVSLQFACKKSDDSADDILPDAEISSEVLTQGLNHPWELVWGPDNMLWMTERNGRISRVDPATGGVTSLLQITDVVSSGEGGLLGMALHPNFTANPHVFVVYNYMKGPAYTEKVVRYTYAAGSLTAPQVLIDNIAASAIHNGSRLLITPDLKLFISTGDAANQQSAQSGSSLSGKILRINLDGTIPADNPNPGSAVWSTGHRNPQGLVFANDRIYSSEHGPDRDDEINIIQRNRNYGWPNVNGFCDGSEQAFCSQNNVAEPLKSWTPTLAVSGIDYYNHNAIPQWRNSILMATLKDETLYQLKLNSGGDQIESTLKIFSGNYGRLRDVCVAPDGRVFVATSNGSNDRIVVLKKK